MLEKLNELHQEMIELREHFHKNPELSFTEIDTPAYIAEYLRKLNIEVQENVGGRGVVASIKNGPGKCVALRADFDALPLTDAKTVPYKSQKAGLMHACGHDCHTAALLGIAKVLAQNPDLFSGEVRLIFQYAEEVAPGGAESMIEDGCITGVDAIFATHIMPFLPVGQYGYRSGPIMANADRFIIDIQGKGGHGALPHETIDPIIITANLINNLQQIVSRKINPFSQAVISVGKVEAGSSFNIIPDSAKIDGTVRTFEKDVQDFIISEIDKITQANCAAAGASYNLEYIKGYPVTKNHEKETMMAKNSLVTITDKASVVEVMPLMGGEDFSYYLEKVPGCMFFTGSNNGKEETCYPLHHPKFDIDKDTVLFAAIGLLTVALDYLN